MLPAQGTGTLFGYYPAGGADPGPMESTIGRKFDLIHHFKDFDATNNMWPTSAMLAEAAGGRTIHIGWELVSYDGGYDAALQPAPGASSTDRSGHVQKTWTYKQVTSGSLDRYLDAVAAKVKATSYKFIVDIDPETDDRPDIGGTAKIRAAVMAGTLGSLFLARWLAILSSHWAWKGIGAHNRELILWVLPRGLITVVLAIRVSEARGIGLDFLPGLAFAVILVTNALLVLASIRARKSLSPVPDVVAEASPQTAKPEIPAPAVARRGWILNALLLFLLAFSGLVLWYGKQPEPVWSQGVVKWIQTHFHRGQ